MYYHMNHMSDEIHIEEVVFYMYDEFHMIHMIHMKVKESDEIYMK